MTLYRRNLIVALLLASLSALDAAAQSVIQYFAIQVVDEQTGRGVPMVELKTTSEVCFYTDSNGLIAFYEPGLMNRKVWFSVASAGYEFPADYFGERGVKLDTRPGTFARLQIKRLNIAERLYRVTGQGIYRDTVLLGSNAPIAEPLLNAEVTGQDSVLNAVYRGRLYWFYGDTLRVSYILGNYSVTGATTALPEKIDPAAGFDLHYFTNKTGFARPMAKIQGGGVVWLSGLVVLPDKSPFPRMMAFYERRRGLGEVLENGFVEYDNEENKFEVIKTLPLNPSAHAQGYSFLVKIRDGTQYAYFTTPYPNLRVRADSTSYLNLSNYESFTCVKSAANDLERDARGKLVWAWRKNTPPLTPKAQQDLITAGKMQREESPFRLQDAATGKPVLLNSCSCCWNHYRQRYVMIASEVAGATMLGEVWYSESTQPEGPWSQARKIITHAGKPGDAHDFYNPVQHSFFDQDGGRVIYLEGSYVNTFSGSHQATPRYEYNQIMYRLDLSDSRLRLPP